MQLFLVLSQEIHIQNISQSMMWFEPSSSHQNRGLIQGPNEQSQNFHLRSQKDLEPLTIQVK